MKRTVRLQLTFFAVALLSLSGCIIHDDDYYTPQPQPQYPFIFQEEFLDDRRGWAFDDPLDSAYAFVANGFYKFVDYSYTGGTHYAVVPTGADTRFNWSARTRISSNFAMAMIFGASPYDFGYSFFIDEAGYFAVFKEGYHPQIIVDWQQNLAIQPGWNDIEVEQLGGEWYGYINGTQVFRTRARNMAGDEFGFMVLAGTVGYADFLDVRW